MTTGGGLVFGGDHNGRFRAFDHETGEVLWEINLGSPITGFPVTYAVGGRQYVAVSTGQSLTSAMFNRMDTGAAGRATATRCSSSRCPGHPMVFRWRPWSCQVPTINR